MIRYLGGLLSAYALTKDPLLLQLADEVRLLTFYAATTLIYLALLFPW